MIAKGLRAVYTAVNAEAAAQALEELDDQWGDRYHTGMLLCLMVPGFCGVSLLGSVV